MEINHEEQQPINWRVGRDRFGKIKRNQRWVKRDTGKAMTILGPAENASLKVIFDGDSRGMKVHTLKMRDIYRYYILL